jgi:hypothetical protein
MANYGKFFLLDFKMQQSNKIEQNDRIDRGKGDEVRALVHRYQSAGPEEWKDIKFMVFDYVPKVHEADMPYEKRLQQISSYFLANPIRSLSKNVEMVEIFRSKGYEHSCGILADIIQKVIFSYLEEIASNFY